MESCDEIQPAGCPVELAISVFGSKWKLLILRVILLNRAARFNELLGAITSLSAKELTRNLKQLVSAGLLDHTGDQYQLSDEGKSLIPIFEAMRDWGMTRMNGLAEVTSR